MASSIVPLFYWHLRGLWEREERRKKKEEEEGEGVRGLWVKKRRRKRRRRCGDGKAERDREEGWNLMREEKEGRKGRQRKRHEAKSNKETCGREKRGIWR